MDRRDRRPPRRPAGGPASHRAANAGVVDGPNRGRGSRGIEPSIGSSTCAKYANAPAPSIGPCTPWRCCWASALRATVALFLAEGEWGRKNRTQSTDAGAFVNGSIGTELAPLVVFEVLPELFPDEFHPVDRFLAARGRRGVGRRLDRPVRLHPQDARPRADGWDGTAGRVRAVVPPAGQRGALAGAVRQPVLRGLPLRGATHRGRRAGGRPLRGRIAGHEPAGLLGGRPRDPGQEGGSGRLRIRLRADPPGRAGWRRPGAAGS